MHRKKKTFIFKVVFVIQEVFLWRKHPFFFLSVRLSVLIFGCLIVNIVSQISFLLFPYLSITLLLRTICPCCFLFLIHDDILQGFGSGFIIFFHKRRFNKTVIFIIISNILTFFFKYILRQIIRGKLHLAQIRIRFPESMGPE